MCPRIQQLPPSVVTKIAAGEVIERPASVLKELLENAVDAGSTKIDIDLEQGGVELIRVVDDGSGIVSEDLPLAFASHATSKLRTADDLFQIGTLGFRGEALASVGGIAQVRLQSRPAGLPHGAEILCRGGELSPMLPWNGSPGTRIEVRQLFYNTPVRRKFLKSISTELGHLTEIFTRLSLAQAQLQLSLRHNGKEVYTIPGSADVLERIGIFFGKEVQSKLYPFRGQQGDVRLSGFVADPTCDRGTAKLQHLFLNGRWIRDRSLGHALQEAYRGLLMTGRYAVAFLFLKLPPDQVDVNVHPTKVEVRFQDGPGLHHLVYATVKNCLQERNLTARLQSPPPAAAWLPDPTPRILEPPPAWIPVRKHEPIPEPRDEYPLFSQLAAPHRQPEAPSRTGKVLQLHDAYLVVETDEGMLVIDQHALHERVLYEQLKERIQAGDLEVQRLLIPEPVDLSAEQSARVLEQKEPLSQLGIGVEDFGNGTILLTSYPAMLERRSPQAILHAVVDHLTEKDRLPSREALFDSLMSLMACKAAVKAGDKLGLEEIEALLRMRHLARDTHHCPHGRPTSLLFSRQELDRQFGRI